jgi:hypothetical protein
MNPPHHQPCHPLPFPIITLQIDPHTTRVTSPTLQVKLPHTCSDQLNFSYLVNPAPRSKISLEYIHSQTRLTSHTNTLQYHPLLTPITSFSETLDQLNFLQCVNSVPRFKIFPEYIQTQTKMISYTNISQHSVFFKPKTSLLRTKNDKQSSPLYLSHPWSRKHQTSKTLIFVIPVIKIHYIVPTYLFLILGGDIELNPGPLRNILGNHPQDHKLRSRKYFTPQTIQIKPKYQQLQTLFEPHLIPTHPQHQEIHQTHPFLSRFIANQTHYPPPILFYSLIVTTSPLLDRCNILLFQPSPLITNLMYRLSLQFQNLEQLTFTHHPYTQFLRTNQETISLCTSIHHKLYEYIFHNVSHVNFESTKTAFPFLPNSLITKALKCTIPLIGYRPPPQNTIHPSTRNTNPEYTNHATYFTTWNI